MRMFDYETQVESQDWSCRTPSFGLEYIYEGKKANGIEQCSTLFRELYCIGFELHTFHSLPGFIRAYSSVSINCSIP